MEREGVDVTWRASCLAVCAAGEAAATPAALFLENPCRDPAPGSAAARGPALDLVDCVSRQDEQRASGPWHIGQYRALALNGLQLLHLSDCRRRCRTSSSVLSGRSNRFFCNRETGLQLCQIIRALLKARETMVWNF